MLARFAKHARHEVGAAGAPVLADKTERLREEWVKDQLVEAGRARARALGWPDAYAYTKALGERALLQRRGDDPGDDRATLDHRERASPTLRRDGSAASAWPSR